MSSSLGHLLKLTSFGESHGSFIGATLDGFPSNFEIDFDTIQKELDKRKPGNSPLSSERKEDDVYKIISGVFEGKTTGSPITFLIENNNAQSKDYSELKHIFRPGHADKVYTNKYQIRDFNGGGRSSARITAAWVAAGALAKQYLLNKYSISIQAVVSSVKNISIEHPFLLANWDSANQNAIHCPDEKKAHDMIELIESAKLEGDSLGGTIACRISNCFTGLGEPVFDKLNADLSKAMFSINAVKGLEFGSGFEGTTKFGSENNDNFKNNSDGGITAGISNGKPIEFKIAFKPTSSIKKKQEMETVDGQIINHCINGRHDPCVLPRAIPIVENLTAIVLLDHLLLNLKFNQK